MRGTWTAGTRWLIADVNGRPRVRVHTLGLYLVEVDGEQFEGDADVVAEGEGLKHVDDVVAVVGVVLAQLVEDADLLGRLPVKALLVADDLERHVAAVAMIARLHHLTETAAAQTLHQCRLYLHCGPRHSQLNGAPR